MPNSLGPEYEGFVGGANALRRQTPEELKWLEAKRRAKLKSYEEGEDLWPEESDLPELPDVARANAFLRRHPTAASFLPDGQTLARIKGMLPSWGGGSEAQASSGGESVQAKTSQAPTLKEMHWKGRAGALREALNLPDDLGEYETLLHDFADGKQGRVVTERLLRSPGDPEAINMARQAFLARLKGQ
jgi:hypothetical protein